MERTRVEGKPLLAWVREGVPPAASDSAQLDAQIIPQQAPEGAS